MIAGGRPLARAALLALVASVCCAAPLLALPPGYSIETVHSGLAIPVGFRLLPGGRLLYIELYGGRVMQFDSDADSVPSVWATVPAAYGTDRGVLGIELHPDYPDSPYVYVLHSSASPLVDRVVRLTDQGNTGTSYTVIRDLVPTTAETHHGGRMTFGPDRLLYVTHGDESVNTAARDSADLRGKLYRITPMGGIPADNPFGPASPIYVRGIRNSFGVCFDRLTGKAYFTDNGPECDDELDLLEAGADYGWGPADPCGGQSPGGHPALLLLSPSIGPTSVLVLRGGSYPGLDGSLFFGTYVDGAVRRVTFVPGSGGTMVDSIEVFAQVNGEHVLDLVQAPDGTIWFSTRTAIYRIRRPGPVAVGGSVKPIERRLIVSPNPFVEHATISFGDGASLERVEILDSAGRRVRLWQGTNVRVGWDGRDERGRSVGAGIYVVRASDRHGVVTASVVHLSGR